MLCLTVTESVASPMNSAPAWPTPRTCWTSWCSHVTLRHCSKAKNDCEFCGKAFESAGGSSTARPLKISSIFVLCADAHCTIPLPCMHCRACCRACLVNMMVSVSARLVSVAA